jgi:type IV pilus assembly protein PilO
MHFINSVERDQNFFVIRTMALTGQQGGSVSLRLKVSTWLRPADAEASGLPPHPDSDEKKRLSQRNRPVCPPLASKEGE